MKKSTDIVTDQDIQNLWEQGCDFGPNAVPRDIVDESLLAVECGIYICATANWLVFELGLVIGSYLTRKGKEYLYATFIERMERLAELEAEKVSQN